MNKLCYELFIKKEEDNFIKKKLCHELVTYPKVHGLLLLCIYLDETFIHPHFAML